MKSGRIIAVTLLTGVWILLREDFSLFTVVSGIILGLGCIYMFGRFLPPDKVADVDFFKLVTYPFYLIAQVYLSGFMMIGIILTQARVDVVQIKTSLRNDFLRVMLAHSITLTPGSVSLDIEDDKITLLWIRKKSDPIETDSAGAFLKGQLEEKLLRAQK